MDYDQDNLPELLSYRNLFKKMSKLYALIPKDTIARQGRILAKSKADLDKWIAFVDERITHVLASSDTIPEEISNQIQTYFNQIESALDAYRKAG